MVSILVKLNGIDGRIAQFLNLHAVNLLLISIYKVTSNQIWQTGSYVFMININIIFMLSNILHILSIIATHV